jgi:hypothetical protein
MATDPKSLKNGTDSPPRSGELKRINPVPFCGGSGIYSV